MIQKCEYPNCNRAALYLNSWDNEIGKHFGMVCATHDRILGQTNLVKLAGMSPQETHLFMHYAKLTENLESYLDWPEWLQQHYETHYPSGVRRHNEQKTSL